MEFDPEWLETVLARHESARAVGRVTKVETEAVVAKGDNYASNITRVRMEVFLGSGRKARRSVIVKALPDTEMRAKFLQEFGMFKKEIMMYTQILPNMARIMEEFGDKDPLWIECIECRPYDRIVLEDLKELGFKMADRRKGLDFHHASIAVEALSKFHALSIALKERGLLDPDDFTKSIYNIKHDMFDAYYDQCIKNLRAAIESNWPEEEKYFSEKLAKYSQGLYGSITVLVENDEPRFRVLNHMDMWVNNIMFKYSGGVEGVPVDLRFVDFQLCHYNSYGLDLQYLTITSLDPDTMESRVPDLLRIYQEGLSTNLKRYQCKVDNVPSLEDVQKEFERLNLFGLALSVSLLNFMKTDPEDVPDMEEKMKELEREGVFAVDMKPFLGKAYTKSIKQVLKNCFKNGIL